MICQMFGDQLVLKIRTHRPMKLNLTFALVVLCSVSMAQRIEYDNIEKELQTKFITAKDGDVIEIPPGKYTFSRTLWLDDKKDITVLGAGSDKTFLAFHEQIDGAEAIKVTGSENIRLEGMTVWDAKGDALKIQETDGIAFVDVAAIWRGKPKKSNGAYGLYPVQSNNVLIDNCVAAGASDAGIYVGQSTNIIVKNSKAYNNVAGIEIENSLHAEVYDNEAYNNTGGILVFDLPGLILKKGGHVKVYNNHVHDNNLANFAPKGNIVGKVPDGTGVIILATSNVEVYKNRIVNNNSLSCGIISYYMTEETFDKNEFDPYPKAVSVHDNYFERENVKATMKGRFGKMFRFKLKFGKDVPHVIYDGILDEDLVKKHGSVPQDQMVCVKNNQNQSFANIDAENDFTNISRDVSENNCELAPVQISSKSSGQ